MTTIVTRAGKGSPLTNTEVDTNFTNLNSDKLETSGGTLSGPTVVSVNSASDALRITQTGAGNALVVEDSANPDSSPFAVNTSGQVLIGRTTAPFGSTSLAIEQSVADTAPSNIDFLKNRAGAIVNSGDGLGRIRFWGYDGAAPIAAAEIVATVDGTPGTNDMPGRLVFSTTADGASTSTERMRISNSGATSITAVGTGGINGTALTVTGTNLSGATTNVGISIVPTFGLGATVRGIGVQSTMNTEAGGAGLATAAQFRAVQGTLSTAVTSQYGFWADSTLIGATNNYGFYSNIASGTGRWNFYANGTANNYFAGQVQLGAGTAAAPALSTTGDTNTGIFFPAADTIAFTEGGVESMRIDSSGNVGIGTSSPGTTRLYISGNRATDPTLQTWDTFNGATFENSALLSYDGTKTFLYNFQANPLAFGTNNAERMRIDSSGNVGIGTSSPKAQTHVFGLGQTTAALTDAGNRGGMLRVSDNSSSAGAGGAILFSSAQGDTANSTGFAAIKGLLLDGSGNTVGDLSFSTRNGTADTSLTERFRIGASGQLGIGGANYGTSGQVLTSNGSGSAPSWQAAGGSTGALKNVQVFTSSGTYTRTSGVTTAVVVAVGGGGGGKGATGKTAGGNGGNGGTTSFGSHVTALGGTGSTGTTGGAGGTGGTGATIAIKGQGGGGGFAFAVGSNIGSLGGSAGGQGGGAGVRNNSAGNAGVRGGGGSGGADTDGTVCAEGSYAGGGGGQGETCIKYTTTVGSTETVTIGAGGTAGTGTRAGGAGGAGYIIVYEYS